MDDIRIVGLEAFTYFINNDLWVEIRAEGINKIDSCDISFYDIRKNKQNLPLRLYSDINGIVRVNISPALKSYFNIPEHNTNYTELTEIAMQSNWGNFDIVFSIKRNGIDVIREIKNKLFIRGGIRTNKTNIIVETGRILSPVSRIPVWQGYPVAEYAQSNTIGIVKRNRNLIPETRIERRREKGYEPMYIKFLNSLGGYSYWLFEIWENEEGNTNLGVLNNYGRVMDIGNVIDFPFSVQSKVPEEYFPLMFDLISSSEIYIYIKDQKEWERISSDKNKLKDNNSTRFHKTKIKFKRYYNYKPQITW